MTTLQKTRQFLARRYNLDEREISPDATLDRLGIDSLAVLELVFELEDEFNVRLDTDGESIRTVGELVKAIDQRLAQECAQAA
jgi:acyl carrier protein